MTELRTRIAAVLYRLYSHGSWEQLLEIERQAWGDDADAVIRELGLREEQESTGWGNDVIATRIVSEWNHQAGCKCQWCRR